MPLYNTLMNVVRPERAPYNWSLPSRTWRSIDGSYMQAVGPLVNNAILPTSIRFFVFDYPDIFGRESFNYFNVAVPYMLNIYCLNQEQPEFSFNWSITVDYVERYWTARNAGRTQNQANLRGLDLGDMSRQATAIGVQGNVSAVSKSTEFTRAFPSFTDIRVAGGYLVSVDKPATTEGFTFPIWVYIDDQGSDIETVQTTPAFGAIRTKTISCSTRYDERIVAGLQVTHGSDTYQIQTVEITERLRTMRLSLTTQSSVIF